MIRVSRHLMLLVVGGVVDHADAVEV